MGQHTYSHFVIYFNKQVACKWCIFVSKSVCIQTRSNADRISHTASGNDIGTLMELTQLLIRIVKMITVQFKSVCVRTEQVQK